MSVVALVMATRTGWGSPAWWGLPLLAVTVALSGYVEGTRLGIVLPSPSRSGWGWNSARSSLSAADAAMAAALLLAPGGWIVLGVVVGVWSAALANRLPRARVEYALARAIAGSGLAAATAASARPALGPVFAAAIGAVVLWAITQLLAAWAVAATSRRSLRNVLPTGAASSAVRSAGTASVGILAGWLALHGPVGLVGLLVPLLLLRSARAEQSRHAQEARLFAELARAQERVSGGSSDTSAEAVLTSAARIFGGADVELLLLAPDGPVRYSGDEFGVPERRRADPGAFDEPWALAALGGGGLGSGIDDGRPWCSVALGPAQAPLAVLRAVRSAGSPAFGRRELLLARVLAGQAESWLSAARLAAARDAALGRASAADESARALGDLGADTAPTLVVLQESAARLVRLSASPGDTQDLAGIVEELHSVERAVASLLGAVALAADPDLTTDRTVAADHDRRAPEWTTSGVLR